MHDRVEYQRARMSDPAIRARQSEYQRQRRANDWRKPLLDQARARAKRDGPDFNITLDDIVIPTHCPVLGIELRRDGGKNRDWSPSLDKTIPAFGYVRGNVQVISNRANRFKSNATLDEVRLLLAHMEKLHGSGHSRVTTH